MPGIRLLPEAGKNIQHCEKIENTYKYFFEHA